VYDFKDALTGATSASYAVSDARTLRMVKMRHRAKFCADRSNRCGNMAVFRFSRWRPSTVLDF